MITVEAGRIYIRDGAIWTSGGITGGIDLALALIEDDLGSEVGRSVAQVLVVHQRRPGGQSQHSALLDLGGSSVRFSHLIAWVRDNLQEPLSVERLAESRDEPAPLRPFICDGDERNAGQSGGAATA